MYLEPISLKLLWSQFEIYPTGTGIHQHYFFVKVGCFKTRGFVGTWSLDEVLRAIPSEFQYKTDLTPYSSSLITDLILNVDDLAPLHMADRVRTSFDSPVTQRAI